MANIEFTHGSLYMVGPKETLEPIGAEITSVEFEYPCEYADDRTYISFLDTTASFECIARLSKDAVMALYGIREAVLRCCPNKRVVHLAFHAKRPRTRKKNFNRAIKILEDLA